MSNNKLIAISGKLKHGKDTFADFIIKNYNFDNHLIKNENGDEYLIRTIKNNSFRKIAFADPIKNAVLQMFPFLTRDDLWGPSERKQKIIEGYTNPLNEKPLMIRDVLTQIGSWGRSCNPNFWVNPTMYNIKEMLKTGHVILTDARFRNELRAIKEANGIVIRITRPNVDYWTDDISETDLDGITDFDKFIVNESLESLEKDAISIINEYLL